MNFINKLSLILVIIGGLNWGLIGLFNFNLVTWLFGTSVFTPIVYILVGLAALVLIFAPYYTNNPLKKIG